MKASWVNSSASNRFRVTTQRAWNSLVFSRSKNASNSRAASLARAAESAACGVR
jgi:hypothetical protein